MKYLRNLCFWLFTSWFYKSWYVEYKAVRVKWKIQHTLHASAFPGLFPSMTFSSHSSIISEISPFLLFCVPDYLLWIWLTWRVRGEDDGGGQTVEEKQGGGGWHRAELLKDALSSSLETERLVRSKCRMRRRRTRVGRHGWRLITSVSPLLLSFQ